MGGTADILTLTPIGAGIAAVGEVDAATSSQLTEAILAVEAGSIVRLDMSRVTFIDSNGLRVLIVQHLDRSEQGSRLEIVAPSPQVRRVLELSGLMDELNVIDE